MTTKKTPDAGATPVAVDPTKSPAEQLLEIQLRKELEANASREALSIVSVEKKEVSTPAGPVEYTETVFANGTIRKEY